MKETPGNGPVDCGYRSEGVSINFLVKVLAKYNRKIMMVVVAVFAISCAATLMMKNYYTATTTIMPPKEDQGGLAMLAAKFGNIEGLMGGLGIGGSSQSEMYVSMLNGRTVSDSIIDKFSLMEYFEAKERMGAYEKLNQMTTISVGKKDGLIYISVEDKDPKLAAEMANAYVEELRSMLVNLYNQSAAKERAFFEEQFKEVTQKLMESEQRLLAFQKKNKAIKLDDQAMATVNSIARLSADLMQKKIELGVMKKFKGDRNPEVIAAENVVAELSRNIAELENSGGGRLGGTETIIAASNMPELGLSYVRLMRDFKVQETIYQVILQQYELTKFSEAKDSVTIKTIDKAVPPDRKSKPRRSVIVIAATLFSMVAAYFWFIGKEIFAGLPKEEQEEWHNILRMFKRS